MALNDVQLNGSPAPHVNVIQRSVATKDLPGGEEKPAVIVTGRFLGRRAAFRVLYRAARRLPRNDVKVNGSPTPHVNVIQRSATTKDLPLYDAKPAVIETRRFLGRRAAFRVLCRAARRLPRNDVKVNGPPDWQKKARSCAALGIGCLTFCLE